MDILSQLLFLILTGISIFLFSMKVKEIRRNVFLGKGENIETDTRKRWRNMLLLAFGQKKMFKNPLVAVMHLVIYVGFIIINIEILEIILDGFFGTHRLFAPAMGQLYPLLINIFEVLAFGVMTACIIFLARRNIIKLKRFISHDLDGWPRSDANYILATEIIIVCLFLTMNASDSILQTRGINGYAEHTVCSFTISSWLVPLLSGLSTTTLEVMERTCWWLHITAIFAFLNYLPYSKHLHILLAFPNAYYTRPEVQGKMKNMPEIQKEVLLAMGGDIALNPSLATLPEAPPAQFGASDIFDLSWKNLLDAYSCTECGRCSASCPATITGKTLSPRLIMMKTRDRLEEVGKNINANKEWKDDGKKLLHDYITTEELRACTTCSACVEACPVSISPLDIILKQRRYLILDESNSPGEWNAMFNNVENNFAPWKFSPDQRGAWMH